MATLASRASVFMALLLCLWPAGCSATEPGPLAVGEPAPSFELPTLEGSRFELTSLRGEPVVLNFWATWCRPCLLEIPILQGIEARGEARVVAVSLDSGGREVVAPFVEEREMTYPVLLDDGHARELYGVNTIPFTVVLDREQKVVSIHRALVSESQLRRELERLPRRTP